MFTALPVLASEAQHTEPEHKNLFVYEVTCHPEKSEYSISPSGGKYQKVKLQTEAFGRLQAMDKDYGIFLNGKYVGQGPFTHRCELTNDITIQTEIDYFKKGRPFFNLLPPPDGPAKYSFMYPNYTNNIIVYKKNKIIWGTSYLSGLSIDADPNTFFSYLFLNKGYERCARKTNPFNDYKVKKKCHNIFTFEEMEKSDFDWDAGEKYIKKMEGRCKKISENGFDCTGQVIFNKRSG